VNFLAGTHTLRARGVSGDGQLSAPSTAITVTATSNTPAIVITAPVSGSRWNIPQFRMRVEARYSAGLNLSAVRVTYDGTFGSIPQGGNARTRLENVTSGISNGVPYWTADVVGLPDGRHILVAELTTFQLRASVPITVDNRSPVVTAALDPAADAQGILRTFPFRVTFTAEDPGSGLNTSTLELKANGEDIHCEVAEGQGLDPAGGRAEDPSVPQSIRAIWTPTIEELADLLQKTQTNRIRACIGIFDLVGNYSEVCVEFTIDYSGAAASNPFLGVRRLPHSIVLQIAPASNQSETYLASSATQTSIAVRAVDPLRGNRALADLDLDWVLREGVGRFVEEDLPVSTGADGIAGMRFVNGPRAETSMIVVQVADQPDVPGVAFQRTAYLPRLELVYSPRDPQVQQPLMLQESFGRYVPPAFGFLNTFGVWVFRASDPIRQVPLQDVEIAISMLSIDPASGLWREDPGAAQLLPPVKHTDALGYAEFNVVGRRVGQYRLQARLREFSGVQPYLEPLPPEMIRIASARSETLDFGGRGRFALGPMGSLIASGNGQLGLADTDLADPVVLDLPGFAANLRAAATGAGLQFVSGTVTLRATLAPPPLDARSWNTPIPEMVPCGTLRARGAVGSVLSFDLDSGRLDVMFRPGATRTSSVTISVNGTFRLPDASIAASRVRDECFACDPVQARFTDMTGTAVPFFRPISRELLYSEAGLTPPYSPSDPDRDIHRSAQEEGFDSVDPGRIIPQFRVPDQVKFWVELPNPWGLPGPITLRVTGRALDGSTRTSEDVVLRRSGAVLRSEKPLVAVDGSVPPGVIEALRPNLLVLDPHTIQVDFPGPANPRRTAKLSYIMCVQEKRDGEWKTPRRLARGRAYSSLQDARNDVRLLAVVEAKTDTETLTYLGDVTDADLPLKADSVGSLARWDTTQQGTWTHVWKTILPVYGPYRNEWDRPSNTVTRWAQLDYTVGPEVARGWAWTVGGRDRIGLAWPAITGTLARQAQFYTLESRGLDYDSRTGAFSVADRRQPDNALALDVPRLNIHDAAYTHPLLRHASTFLNTPWLFSSDGPTQAASYYGTDCNDFVMSAINRWRREGKFDRLPYTGSDGFFRRAVAPERCMGIDPTTGAQVRLATLYPGITEQFRDAYQLVIPPTPTIDGRRNLIPIPTNAPGAPTADPGRLQPGDIVLLGDPAAGAADPPDPRNPSQWDWKHTFIYVSSSDADNGLSSPADLIMMANRLRDPTPATRDRVILVGFDKMADDIHIGVLSHACVIRIRQPR